MTDILEIVKSAAIDALLKNIIDETHNMLDIKHEGGDEILANFVKKGLSFSEECKYTITEKNGTSLDIIVSHPDMEDLKYKEIQNSSNITSDVLPLFMKYVKISRHENANISYKEFARGKNNYTKIKMYLNKKLYDSLN